MGAVVFQCLLVLLDRYSSKEDRDFDIFKVFAETLILLVNLEGELSENEINLMHKQSSKPHLIFPG